MRVRNMLSEKAVMRGRERPSVTHAMWWLAFSAYFYLFINNFREVNNPIFNFSRGKPTSSSLFFVVRKLWFSSHSRLPLSVFPHICLAAVSDFFLKAKSKLFSLSLLKIYHSKICNKHSNGRITCEPNVRAIRAKENERMNVIVLAPECLF